MINGSVVFLIDSSNLVYRCFYAIKSLTTSTGFPTNAIHGVLKTLRQWVREYDPGHMAMVVDGETPAECQRFQRRRKAFVQSTYLVVYIYAERLKCFGRRMRFPRVVPAWGSG